MNPKLVFATDALELRVCRTEKFKAGLLSVSAVLPIDAESAPLTSLLLSVLRRGTEKFPTLEAINRRLDYLYGTEFSIRNFYRGDCQVIGFSAELLNDTLLPAHEDLTTASLDLICQILYRPLLDENGLLLSKYVESEKQFQCDAIRALKNNPRAYATEQCNALLYRDNACGASIYGTEEQILKVTPASLTAFWRSLIQTLTFRCFYVGSTDEQKLRMALEQTLCKEQREHLAAHTCSPRAVQAVTPLTVPLTGGEKMEVGQSHLLLGFTSGCVIGSQNYHAFAVFNELLGCSPTSRLFVHVREKLSLCYHCSSSYNSFKGTLLIQCGLHRDNRARAEEEIKRQIDLIAQGDVNNGELEAAKKSLGCVYRQTEDSPTATEGFYFGRALASMDENTDACIDAINRVTIDDIVAIAKNLRLHTVYFLEGTLEGGEEEEDEDY